MSSFVAGFQVLPACQPQACIVKLCSSVALLSLCRHMYGIDVPKSCQAALLYYNPVAERVVEAARAPGQLPPVSTLSHGRPCAALALLITEEGGLCRTASPAQTQHSDATTWTGVPAGALLPTSKMVGTSVRLTADQRARDRSASHHCLPAACTPPPFPCTCRSNVCD